MNICLSVSYMRSHTYSSDLNEILVNYRANNVRKGFRGKKCRILRSQQGRPVIRNASSVYSPKNISKEIIT